LEEKRKEWEDARPKRIELKGFDEDNLSDLTLEEIVEGEEVVEPAVKK